MLIAVLFESVCKLLQKPWSVFEQRWRAWQFLFFGPSIIQQEYDKVCLFFLFFLFFQPAAEHLRLSKYQAEGLPFEVYAPDNRYVFVSSAKQIKEIDDAPDEVLSLHAATKQVCQSLKSHDLLTNSSDASTEIYYAWLQLA